MKSSGVALAALCAILAAASRADNPPAARGEFPKNFPDPAALVQAIKQTPGCLGAETARSDSGKYLIFAWFEDKKALLDWYNGDAHQEGRKKFFGLERSRSTLPNVPDNNAPILVIACFKMSDKENFKETALPVAQISIELYQPLPGGIAAGGRFAPDKLKVPKMRDYAPTGK